MNAKSQNTAPPWVDPDDAPELTDAAFAKGAWQINGRDVPRTEDEAAMRAAVRRGRPPGSATTSPTVRFDNDVIAAFRATGRGLQSRMNAALPDRSEERRVGKECASTCETRWAAYN